MDSILISNVYINMAVNGFVEENEILDHDFSIVSKRQHFQGKQSLPIDR